MKSTLLIAALGVAASGFAMADSYQSEVGLSASREDLDGVNSSSNDYKVDGKYYFNLVKTDNLPLAEAAYLGKNSNVFAALSRNYGHGYQADSKTYSGGVEVYIPENFLYIKVAGAHTSYDQNSDNEFVSTLGITPLDGLRVTTDWNSDEGYNANVSAKYVTDIGNGQFINVETTLVDDGEKSIGGDFYFDNTFSVGASYRDYETIGKEYEIRTRKFFTESFSGELSYADTDRGNQIALSLNVRF